MSETRIILSGLWAAVMLTYLLGDVLRMFAGDFEPGKLAGGVDGTPVMWMGIAVVMVLPIVFMVLTLILKQPAARWLNLIGAGFFVLFGIASLPYPGMYDNFLMGVSFVFNAATIWFAWQWI